MSNDPVPHKDALYLSWGQNFANVASNNGPALHLTSAEITALNLVFDAFAGAYASSEAQKAVTKGLVAQKTATRKTSETAIRNIARKVLADATISPSLKGELGLNPNPTPGGIVSPPVDLTATGYANGTNALKWKRAGNVQGTIFMVEAKIGTATSFSFVAAVTAAKFNHMGQTPGEQIVYRVSAKRGGVQSGPSNEAIVYSLSEAQALTLEVAA